MAEETKAPETTTAEGGWSGLKKTLIGTLTTAIAGGGVWLSTLLSGGHKEAPKEEHKTETAAPAPAPAAAPVVINLSNNNTNQQKQSASGGNSNATATAAKPKEEPKKEEKKKETDSPWQDKKKHMLN